MDRRLLCNFLHSFVDLSFKSVYVQNARMTSLVGAGLARFQLDKGLWEEVRSEQETPVERVLP
jgi:hypothetical protein